MRSLKTNGGLTRGRGMEETQRLRWLLAMPACAEVSDVMQELTGKHFHTSEQHKEMTEARRERDRIIGRTQRRFSHSSRIMIRFKNQMNSGILPTV